MAALTLPKQATYVVSESYEVNTEDNEDHTFNGVMFTLEARDLLPVDYIAIEALAVRGGMGPLTVWVTPDSYHGVHEDMSQWHKVYERTHGQSMRQFATLRFESPIIVRGGESVGLYVHSALDGDSGIVYDNQRSQVPHSDLFIRLGAGMAHLSNRPFSPHGLWGGAWRQRRQFVGRVSYGIKYLLWTPEIHSRFPPAFRRVARLFAMVPQQPNCPLSNCSNEVLYYILNMCRHDWFPILEGDSTPAQAVTEEQAERDRERNAAEVPHRQRLHAFLRALHGAQATGQGTVQIGPAGSLVEAMSPMDLFYLQLLDLEMRMNAGSAAAAPAGAAEEDDTDESEGYEVEDYQDGQDAASGQAAVFPPYPSPAWLQPPAAAGGGRGSGGIAGDGDGGDGEGDGRWS